MLWHNNNNNITRHTVLARVCTRHAAGGAGLLRVALWALAVLYLTCIEPALVRFKTGPFPPTNIKTGPSRPTKIFSPAAVL